MRYSLTQSTQVWWTTTHNFWNVGAVRPTAGTIEMN
jgi:hypothetical protein